MSWTKGEYELVCDTCPAIFRHPFPGRKGEQAARVKGWHIFRGTSLTGKFLDVSLCPKCVGTPRSKPLPPIDRLVEDEPLF